MLSGKGLHPVQFFPGFFRLATDNSDIGTGAGKAFGHFSTKFTGSSDDNGGFSFKAEPFREVIFRVHLMGLATTGKGGEKILLLSWGRADYALQGGRMQVFVEGGSRDA